MTKKIALVFIIIIIIITVILIAKGNIFMPWQKTSSQPTPTSQPSVSEKDPPQIVSTKPTPLDDAVISGTNTIEVTFNRPLENEGEFKVKIEPKVEFKVSVSNERKTGVITFQKPLELGMSYTLFIGPETKFTGMGRWGEEKIFHFRTIPYKGV